MLENEENIYALELHDKLLFEDGMSVLRVPGGWIYTFTQAHVGLDKPFDPRSVFVPFDNEFENTEDSPWDDCAPLGDDVVEENNPDE